ncbi:MAG: hypothetical protein AAGF74_08280 [Pseudomonadota bacterium]
MTFVDITGVAAGLFVILAFHAKNPRWLRRYAIASNALFVFYAWQMALWPVILLHAILLPLNTSRLIEAGHPNCERDPRAMPEHQRDRLSMEMRLAMGCYRYRGTMG